jgi:hypothetical protein
MGVKLLRTYNTSQFPQVARLLQAIETVKQTDPDFEMYVMLGAWIESKNAWTEAVWDAANNAWVEGTGPDHSEGNVTNNTQEIETAIRLANAHPDIVKAIAVGNEAMVQWATNYFVYPKTILKWVKYLQDAKASGTLTADEYKQQLFHRLLREWTDEAGISLFFFEAFDEQWKKASSPDDSTRVIMKEHHRCSEGTSGRSFSYTAVRQKPRERI